MLKQPLAEVFGFPINNNSPEAARYREKRLCPFNNKVPNCTKDKANDPLGVCSVYEGDSVAITCPIRFREEWQIADKETRASTIIQGWYSSCLGQETSSCYPSKLFQYLAENG